MGHLAIFALGPLRIELDGRPLQTSRHKALALLVYLAMNPGKQSREALSALLWPDYEQEKAYAYLRRTLWEIHTLLGTPAGGRGGTPTSGRSGTPAGGRSGTPAGGRSGDEGWLAVDREEIGFNLNASIHLDVEDFQAHLASFHRHNHPAGAACPACTAHLHTAALLYRGDFLAGFSLRDSANFEDWQFFQNEALRRDYAAALEKLAILLRFTSAFDEAALFARRWLALDTLNEAAHRELMRTYALNGERNHALRQYQECRRLLQIELGVAPEGATLALYEQIQSGTLPQLEETQPEKSGLISASPTSTASKGNELDQALSTGEAIPAGFVQAQAGPFIGRESELKQINTLLSDPNCWLLTLLGSGGIGKTRLAVEAGSHQQGCFSQGIFFVPLNVVESEESLTAAIARATGLTFRQNGLSPEEQLLDFLREKQLLLILDSFESLVQTAELLGKIHLHAKMVKMLVTSRHRLPLQGAWVMEIKGLDYPQKPPESVEEFRTYSAAELFLLAAQRADVGFHMAESDLQSIARITRLLEGMPLGLELAAAWIKTLSCQEIADEIGRSLDFLETSLLDLPERQRSIRSVFDYSWNLLNSREQRLFPRLAIFQGRFTRQAAEQIAGISLRELAGLVDKSLVQRPSDGHFALHDLLRQYCLENLDRSLADSQETRNRHCAFYCARLSKWNEDLGGNKPGQVLREIETDLENARAAWEWAVSQGQIEQLEKAADGLGTFFLRRARFTEGLDICQRAEAALREVLTIEGRRLRARLLIWQAVFSLNLTKFQDAGLSLNESQSIIDNLTMDAQPCANERVFLLTIQAEHALLQYDPSNCLDYFEQSFDLARKSGMPHRWAVFFWRYLMSAGTVSKKEYLLFKANLPYVREHSDLFETGCTLYTLGMIEAFWYYRLDEAGPLLRESIEIFKKLDDPVSLGMIYKTLGFLFLFQGNFADHLAQKQHEVVIYQDLGDRRLIGISLSEAGEICYLMGKYEEAERYLRSGLDLLKDIDETEYALRHRYLGDTLLSRGKVQEARDAYLFSFLFFQQVGGNTWTVTALTGLSRAELALGDRASAWEHTIQALHAYREGKVLDFFVYQTVANFALLLADTGKLNEALELFGLASQQLTLANSPWFADLYGRFMDETAAKLPLAEQAEAKRRGQALDLSGTIESLITRFAP